MHRGPERPAGRRKRFDRVKSRQPIGRAIVKITVVSALCAGLLAAGGQSGAGHQVGHYPSYYPDEIRIDAVDPAAAGKALTDQTLHAYVGTAPSFKGPVPEHLKSVKSLGSFLVLSFNATSRFASADSRCTAARGVMAALRNERAGGFVFHPYPVTPFHADYLHHVDRIETITGALADRPASAAPIKVSAKGSVAEAVVRARLGQAPGASELTLEVVPVDNVLAPAGRHLDGRSGLPWVKEGWFHAHLLLTPGLDATSRRAADEAYDRLIRSEIRDLAERTDLERRLVGALTAGCQRLVVGYVLKEEFFNDAYPDGAENIAYDSMSGFNSPVFVRTVKLKDYPWNGKLHLAVPEPSKAAWNPIGGFTDVMGRLIWSAVGDPAMISFPDNASWMPNRIQSEVVKIEGQSGGFKLPPDAIAPQPGSGMLQRVGDRAFSSTKVVYEVLTSPFEDGSVMTVGDLLYPFAFAGRWGATTGVGGNNHEPRVAAIFADLQERLVGLKVARIEKTTHTVAEGLTISADAPVVEVYLRNAPGDERQIAALAAPWSTMPWHLLALMEEAVARGYAAFSQEEAARRHIPWLDLVRDQPLRAKLQTLIAQFEQEGYRPEALKEFVPAEEARLRWRSLREFAEKNGHLLVANGPYRLKQWTPDSVVLDAVRELTYPLGFGTFDRFVNPPHATIEAVTQDGGEITARASVEMVMKMGRQYKPVKEPLLRTTARGTQGLLVVSRYLLIDPDGKVINVDKMQWRDDGLFTIKLPERLPAGQYTVILGIFPDGNFLQPSAKILKVRLGAAASPG